MFGLEKHFFPYSKFCIKILELFEIEPDGWYFSDICKSLMNFKMSDPSLSKIHNTLARMEANGFLNCEKIQNPSKLERSIGRHLYTITSDGLEILQKARAMRKRR